MVTVREIRQNGGRVDGREDTHYSGPLLTLYVIAVNGRRYDSRLSKRAAMAAAMRVADGSPVVFEPCALVKYGAKPAAA
ncbi:MAG TPA: hypothetical protein DCY18_11800 [Thauera sp.]|nr:hypothetical protein [Thauera sp.]HRJ24995.1 hypothetical protein [Thauera sp.]